MDRNRKDDENTDAVRGSAKTGGLPEVRNDSEEPNPPHTTTGKITSPKFGSAGSGGLEYEGPDLKKD